MSDTQATAGDPRLPPLHAEIDRLRADNENYVNRLYEMNCDNNKLRAALEPFVRNVNAQSLSKALGHIERQHLWDARNALERAALNEETK